MKKQVRIFSPLLLALILIGLVGCKHEPTGSKGNGVITFITTKNVGETIKIDVTAKGGFTIEGVKEQPQSKEHSYTLTAQEITIYGDVKTFSCDQSQLTSLIVSGCPTLTDLDCSDNQLTALDLSKNIALANLECSDNQLAALDLSKNVALTNIDCSGNQLTALDLSRNVAIMDLDCNENKLTKLNLSKNVVLQELECSRNQLTELQLPKSSMLSDIECYGNQIKGNEMTRLVNSLPDRAGRKTGEFIVVQEPQPEGNRCLKSDVAIAKAKNWQPMMINPATDPSQKGNYEGI